MDIISNSCSSWCIINWTWHHFICSLEDLWLIIVSIFVVLSGDVENWNFCKLSVIHVNDSLDEIKRKNRINFTVWFQVNLSIWIFFLILLFKKMFVSMSTLSLFRYGEIYQIVIDYLLYLSLFSEKYSHRDNRKRLSE